MSDFSNFNISSAPEVPAKKPKKKSLFGKKEKTKKKAKAPSVKYDASYAIHHMKDDSDQPKKKSLFNHKSKAEKQAEKEEAFQHRQALMKTAEQVQKLQENQNRTLIIRQQLTGPTKLIGDKELFKLVKMDTSMDAINKRMQTRVLTAGIAFFAMLIVGLITKKLGMMVVAGVMLAGMTWFYDIQNTNKYYMRFQMERQMAFSQFVRLAASYLPEMSDGANLFSIFKKILPRLEHKRDRAALERLMIRMQKDPNDSKPFNDFAHDFSVSDRAILIMQVIQRMYLGDTNDSNIQALAKDADDEIISQIDQIIEIKLHKFDNTTTKIMIGIMIPLLGFFGLFLLKQVSSVFSAINIGQKL